VLVIRKRKEKLSSIKSIDGNVGQAQRGLERCRRGGDCHMSSRQIWRSGPKEMKREEQE
jgi:hypothetical protein